MILGQSQMIGATLAGFIWLVAASSLSLLGQEPPTANGKELLKRRSGGCHALDRDKEGPRLAGVYRRMAGSVDSFDYSEALKKSGVLGNDESLNEWLTDPEQFLPNNQDGLSSRKARLAS